MLTLSNHNPKLNTRLSRLHNLIPVILQPPLNVIKLQFTLTHNLQKLPQSHPLQLPLCENNWHGAHFPLNVQFFNIQKITKTL